ncbi:MAG TPA: universal stress protein [Gaiellaceae bacterium]|nr:universal stress protein [Gaiellaceae bacterium]
MRLRRRNGRPQVTRILVATDRSETAERAVGFATEMAARYEAELLLLRVLLSDEGVVAEAARDLAERARELAGERGRSSVVVAEDPADAIVEAARREEADVVVVGSVGMAGRKEFLLRNVPNRVSHNAPCTVVIVQTREDS